MSKETEFLVAEATSEDGRGWYWHLTLTKHDCLIGPFATEKEATKDALETITGRAVSARVDDRSDIHIVLQRNGDVTMGVGEWAC
jgi:hypothetical protein